MDVSSFRQALAAVRSLPAACVQYLMLVAAQLPPEKRARIIAICHKADARIAAALRACLQKFPAA